MHDTIIMIPKAIIKKNTCVFIFSKVNSTIDTVSES